MKILLCSLTMLATVSLPASIIINLYESGPDVVMDYSGDINLSGLTKTLTNQLVTGGMNPADGVIRSVSGNIDAYRFLSGPSSFGTGGGVTFLPSSFGSGQPFATFPVLSEIEVPTGYTSLAPLSGSGTWSGESFSSLGVTPGVYTWTIGSNTITMNAIEPIPEPTTYIAIAGFAGLGLFLWRRRKRAHQPAQ